MINDLPVNYKEVIYQNFTVRRKRWSSLANSTVDIEIVQPPSGQQCEFRSDRSNHFPPTCTRESSRSPWLPPWSLWWSWRIRSPRFRLDASRRCNRLGLSSILLCFACEYVIKDSRKLCWSFSSLEILSCSIGEDFKRVPWSPYWFSSVGDLRRLSRRLNISGRGKKINYHIVIGYIDRKYKFNTVHILSFYYLFHRKWIKGYCVYKRIWQLAIHW